MGEFQEIRHLLLKLQCVNLHTQSAIMKEIAAKIQRADRYDLQQFLELLVSTHDIELQVKLFSVLAANLVSDSTNYELVAKYNPLYNTIQNLLMGVPYKVTGVLNFVLALLSFDDDKTFYARNMIRISGSLNALGKMFGDGLMYQDTFIILCQCLAEACRNTEVNQSYCSHLVPLCVQRCRQVNMEACTVLQSLLSNHERNIEIFLNSNGLTIFTRQMLQYDISMQLLDSIVKKSETAVSMLRTSDVIYHLRDFLRLYGPYSQLGQWSTIILFHLDARNAGEDISMRSISQKTKETNITKVNNISENHKQKIINNSFQHSQRRVTVGLQREKTRDVSHTERDPDVFDLHDEHMHNHDVLKSDETRNLFQNVIKEVIHWNSQNKGNFNRRPPPTNTKRDNCLKSFQVKNLLNGHSMQRLKQNRNTANLGAKDMDLTFSFRNQETFREVTVARNNKLKDSFVTQHTASYSFEDMMATCDKEVQTTGSDLTFVANDPIDMNNFDPPFVSTPKNNKSCKTNATNSTTVRRCNYNIKERHKKTQSPKKEVKALQRRSMSSRLFSAINESCTTFVRSVKSIFKANDEPKCDSKDETFNNEEVDISYSFTNYMRKRDSLLENLHSTQSSTNDTNSVVDKVNPCKTCKDTIVLQTKMKRNDNLRRTVKKLKIGLNLYGCNFKKICKVLWPHDKYMSSEILYCLYRKLIVKNGRRHSDFGHKALVRNRK